MSEVGDEIMGKLLNIDSSVMRIMALLADLIILNTLFILTSLPLITIGASLCTLQTSLQKILHQNRGSVIKNYFKSFSLNFRQATIFFIILSLLTFILFYDFRLVSYLPLLLSFLMRTAAFILCVFIALASVYGFSYIGRYKNSLKKTVYNILLLSIQNWFQSFFLLIFNGFIIYFSFTSPQALLTMIYFLTFGGFSVINLVNSIMIKQVFDRIERVTH